MSAVMMKPPPTGQDTAYKDWVDAGRPDCAKYNGFLRSTLEEMDDEEIVAASSTSKPTNPKDAVGIRKVPFSVIPMTVIAELGLAMLEGARKYGRHNYRSTGVRASVYVDATTRHVASFWEGQDIDPASKLSHITKAIASLTVLRDSMIRGNWVDDRPPRVKDGWVEELNQAASVIIDATPNAVAPFTEAGNAEFTGLDGRSVRAGDIDPNRG